ncbi:2-hydroxycarboxylate transporter family protein [Paenibacillus polymyxa]|uniref:2-hydroxycarboxylate transporter family protein n=1 Tax=Paenibacillus polymyxa TaxID=1406 RepID=UPI0004DF875B|nr:2-hydroxycarboxylate transporter family protein [Paenibacillus polymyxa]MBY7739551.1 2-hydroxycarboxylate transporter family protein [Paenibacillus polymyxa]
MENATNQPVIQKGQRWSKNTVDGFRMLGRIKVGVIPLPLYAVIALIVYAAAITERLPNDLLGGFAVIMILGILLSDLGAKLPLLKHIGGPAILSLMVPSLMVFWNMFSPSAMGAVHTLMKTSNFLYFYIACLVTGSILGMDRKMLMNGIVKIFAPIIIGSIAAVAVGMVVGMAFGYSAYHTFFFIIIPIISGGIGEGILPLSISYGMVLGKDSAVFVSQFIPAAIIGNIVAIIGAGVLKRLAEKKPKTSGNGRLLKLEKGEGELAPVNLGQSVSFPLMGGGLLLACTFFIVGKLLEPYLHIPGPILMILAAALIKCIQIMPNTLEQGAFHLYKCITASLTWPLMVGLGILYVPLDSVIGILTVPYAITCASVVVALIVTGYFTGKWIHMYPVEAALVTSCRGGLGGTGDVAILSASNRMELMPFAQIATRIGGAGTVILATLLLQLWS